MLLNQDKRNLIADELCSIKFEKRREALKRREIVLGDRFYNKLVSGENYALMTRLPESYFRWDQWIAIESVCSSKERGLGLSTNNPFPQHGTYCMTATETNVVLRWERHQEKLWKDEKIYRKKCLKHLNPYRRTEALQANRPTWNKALDAALGCGLGA